MRYAVITQIDGTQWLRCYIDGLLVYEQALSQKELAALIRDAAKGLAGA